MTSPSDGSAPPAPPGKRKRSRRPPGPSLGYPDAVTPPATEEEAEAAAQRKAKMNAAPSRPLGAPEYHKPAGSPRLRVSGMTYEEAAEWFRTGEGPE